jgi:peptidoglycan/LPS O-acetylase OafA/YrhL
MQHLTHPKYRSDIDGLRAVAVLSVVGFHAFPNWIKGGFVGVDIFFVISGYLISTIIFGNLENGSFSYAEFYARRIKRIFPALILVLVSSYAFGWYVLLAADYKQLGKHIASGAGFISNFVLWLESGYFDSDAKTKPLLHLWSLGIEEQFYIIWPLLLGLVWKRKWNFLTVTLLIAAASFAANIFTVANYPVSAFYSPLSRFWELMIGGILAYITLHRPQHLPQIRWQSTFGLVLITLGILLVSEDSQFPGWWALLPTIGAFLMIAAGPGAWLNRHLLSNRFFVWIGLISYPLYLWHWPLLSFARIIEGEVPSKAIRIAAVLASFVLAWVTYKLIERPIRDRKRESKKAIIIALCSVMTVVCFLGFNIYDRDGLTFRNVNRAAISGGFYDWDTGYRNHQCFINSDSRFGPSSFADYCSGISKKSKTKPLVMIWGDSYAASLYRGLYNQKSHFDFDLAQYNASACPPIVDFIAAENNSCKDINQYVAQKIKELRPNTVILGACWSLYNGAGKMSVLDYDKLKSTIQLLRNLGIPNIVLVGHLPLFKTGQPDVGVKEFVANKVDRTYRNFNPVSVQVNEKIRTLANESGVSFVSPIDLLCNAEGCLISTSKAKLTPLAWDNAHLTEVGSTLLIDLAIKNKILYLPPK